MDKFEIGGQRLAVLSMLVCLFFVYPFPAMFNGPGIPFGIYDAVADLFARTAVEPALRAMLSPLDGVAGDYASWWSLNLLSMLAIKFLPRQSQLTVFENVDEMHLSKALWQFPMYILAIDIFVLPFAFGGVLRCPGGRCMKAGESS